MNSIAIADRSINESTVAVLHNGVPVVTSELLANLYGTDTENIKKNFTRNKCRFVEGKHYFKLEGDALKGFKNKVTNSPLVKVASTARHLALWTERGAARHAKMLETDRAWDVFERLEDFYFSQRGEVEPVRKAKQSTAKQLTPLRQTVERLIATGMGNIYGDIWKLVHKRYEIDTINQLQPTQISEAISYLDGLEGEFIGKEKRAVAKHISYPMEWFDPYKWIIGAKSLTRPWNYPVGLLVPNGDYPNPIARLLTDLEQAGYEVDAARFQLHALQHHLEVTVSKLDRITQITH